jgi:hypothetical protein
MESHLSATEPRFAFATSPKEREAVCRLRYEVQVEELRQYLHLADHGGRRLADADDDRARHLCAWIGDDLVGALRLHFGADGPFPKYYVEMYELDRFVPAVAEADHVAMFNLLVMKKEHRGGPLFARLMAECIKAVVAQDTQLGFADCQPHLVGTFERFGLRPFGRVTNHPIAGLLVPLLMTDDREYLDRIGAPIAAFFRPGSQTGARLAPLLRSSPVRRGEGADAEAYLREIRDALGQRPAGRVDLFEGLSEEAVQQVLANSHVIECGPGHVLRRGQGTRTVFVVLDGALEARDGDRLLGEVGVGDVIGELAYLLAVPRTCDVIVTSERARLLSLSERTLRGLVDVNACAAAAVSHNLARVVAARLVRR